MDVMKKDHLNLFFLHEIVQKKDILENQMI